MTISINQAAHGTRKSLKHYSEHVGSTSRLQCHPLFKLHLHSILLTPETSRKVLLTLQRAEVSSGYTLPSRSNLDFLISDIRALWPSALSARVPECQKLKIYRLDLDGIEHFDV